jgi:hypothetical protein
VSTNISDEQTASIFAYAMKIGLITQKTGCYHENLIFHIFPSYAKRVRLVVFLPRTVLYLVLLKEAVHAV